MWLDYSAKQLAQEQVHNRYGLWNELKCDGAGESCENLLKKKLIVTSKYILKKGISCFLNFQCCCLTAQRSIGLIRTHRMSYAGSPKAQHTPLLAAWSNCQSVNLCFSPEQGYFSFSCFLLKILHFALLPLWHILLNSGVYLEVCRNFPYIVSVSTVQFFSGYILTSSSCLLKLALAPLAPMGSTAVFRNNHFRGSYHHLLLLSLFCSLPNHRPPQVPQGLLLDDWSLCTNC